MTRFLLAAILALLAAAPAGAHDFWIEPSTFRPTAGAVVEVTLSVGERLVGDTVPRHDALIERFVAIDATGETPVAGLDGQDPAGLLRPRGPGGAMIVYRSLRSRVELDAPAFASYLELEGLPSASPGSEVFSRCAKALLAVGGRGSSSFTKPVGLKLEIVPEADPYALAPGAALTVRVFYDGKALENALVVALDRAMADRPQRIRTDAAGRARVQLPRTGIWLVKAVHMIAAPSEAGAKWESFWASLTFSR